MTLCENFLAGVKEESPIFISFTGANKNVGCSTVSLNFAAYMAKYKNLATLLVDGNIYNPSLTYWFQASEQKGISDIMLNSASVEEAIMRTKQENLSFLSVGKKREMLETVPFHSIFEFLLLGISKDYKIVTFDAPPVNISTDSAILSSKLDGTILVIEAENTRWEVAKKAKETLEKYGKILGVVMNKRKYHIPEWLYSLL
jgi:capsular exopolysaccharide synthesis family protein